LPADDDGGLVDERVESGAELVGELTKLESKVVYREVDRLDFDHPLPVRIYNNARLVGLVPHRGRFDHARSLMRQRLAAGQELVPDPAELSMVHLGPFKAGTGPRKLHADRARSRLITATPSSHGLTGTRLPNTGIVNPAIEAQGCYERPSAWTLMDALAERFR
jgi:hypothetical protein